MSASRPSGSVSRRDVLTGLGLAATASAAATLAAEQQPARARAGSQFEVERFIEDCRQAGKAGAADAQRAMEEVLKRAMSDPASVLAGVGEPTKGGIRSLYRSPSLTILNIVWSPLMQLMPHEHNMWALIGIYTGREDNIFWERGKGGVSAAKAAAISTGDVVPLPREVIHSVSNPIEKLTGAIHIYGGDFFATPRSEWDPETLAERPWDLQGAIRLFEQSNARFLDGQARGACPSGKA